jgi:sugar lactone lactonase YvrE
VQRPSRGAPPRRPPCSRCSAELPARKARRALTGVVAPGVEPELVQEGFVFTEGPVAAPDGGLYFSDIRPNRIYRLDPSGKIDLVREQTNGANGLAAR